MKKIGIIKIILVGVLLNMQLAFAATDLTPVIAKNNYDYTKSIQMDFEKLSQTEQKAIADNWQVTREDYDHYLWLMENTTAGKWYSNLNPAEVLGLYAKDDNERMRFAKIIVQNTMLRIQRELLLQKAYDQAWQALYPQLKPIQYPNENFKSAKLRLQTTALLLFIHLHDEKPMEIGQLIRFIQAHHNIILNIYFVGDKTTDAMIEAWAKKANIPVSLVANGQITLNHDQGHFKQLTHDKEITPFLGFNKKNQLIKVSMEDLEQLT